MIRRGSGIAELEKQRMEISRQQEIDSLIASASSLCNPNAQSQRTATVNGASAAAAAALPLSLTLPLDRSMEASAALIRRRALTAGKPGADIDGASLRRLQSERVESLLKAASLASGSAGQVDTEATLAVAVSASPCPPFCLHTTPPHSPPWLRPSAETRAEH